MPESQKDLTPDYTVFAIEIFKIHHSVSLVFGSFRFILVQIEGCFATLSLSNELNYYKFHENIFFLITKLGFESSLLGSKMNNLGRYYSCPYTNF